MISVNLLWTGGLDSTFRLCELSREDVEVNPYYVIEKSRGSNIYERSAMNRILYELRLRSSTKAKINDVRFIDIDTLDENKDVEEARKRLGHKYGLGTQYGYLERFAEKEGIKLELGLENSPQRGSASKSLIAEGDLTQRSYFSFSQFNVQKIDNQVFEYYSIGANASKDIDIVFKNLIFPAHLFNITKEEEYEIFKRWGMEDIAKKTWFCYDPVLGKPCGRCAPCQDALHEGMEWRIRKIDRIISFGRHYFYRLPKDKVKYEIKKIFNR